MRLQLWGTATADGWSAPFCTCDTCEEARRRSGANIRTRSGALLDDDFKIDFCADTLVRIILTAFCCLTSQTVGGAHGTNSVWPVKRA